MSLGNNMIMASGAVIEPENVSIPVLTPRNETFTITVVNSGGNKFYANGQNSLYVELYQGFTYTFDQSDASNSGHPLRFSTSQDGSDYTDGVTSSGTPGQSGAYTRIAVASNAPSTLWIKCSNHTGMGFSTPVNAYNNTLYGTDGTWNTSGDFTRQWQRGSDATSWSNISGATSNSYTLTSGDAGYKFRFVVTLTNDAGSATANSVQSDATAGQWYATGTSGSTSWTAPPGVTSISIFGVGKGGSGSSYCNQVTSGVGGGGGASGYSNNVSVTPGTTYYVNWHRYYQSGTNGWSFYGNVSGITTSSSGSSAPESSYLFYVNSAESPGQGQSSKSKADTKNNGGQGSPNNSSAGAGGGGYTGAGGNGGVGNQTAGADGSGGAGGGGCGMASYSNSGGGGGPGGGGVGLNGQGTNGAGGTFANSTFNGGGGGSGGTDGGDATQGNTTAGKSGGNYGAGGGGGGAWYGYGPCSGAGQGTAAGIRIIWGEGRAYPSTNTADV